MLSDVNINIKGFSIMTFSVTLHFYSLSHLVFFSDWVIVRVWLAYCMRLIWSVWARYQIARALVWNRYVSNDVCVYTKTLNSVQTINSSYRLVSIDVFASDEVTFFLQLHYSNKRLSWYRFWGFTLHGYRFPMLSS